MSTPIELVVRNHLDPSEIYKVVSLIEGASSVDGLWPLSEHAWLHLQQGGDSHGHHVLALSPSGAVVGYAHVDITDVVQGASAELVVAPEHRHTGIGRSLVDTAAGITTDGRLRLWAHGESSGARELAQAMGFNTQRSLWQMRRSLFAPLPRAEVPEGVRIRTFEHDRDIDAWLDVNRRAFVDLPDQGSWTRHDLELRLHESWYTPQGFFIAERISDSALVGFHWTKVHGGKIHRGKAHSDSAITDSAITEAGQSDGYHQHEPMGEIYVLAVDPKVHIPGLGRALSLKGLAYLRTLGLTQAMLYVDADNTRAITLYERLGFVHWDTDVLYRRG
jgi:mycothiol synthase